MSKTRQGKASCDWTVATASCAQGANTHTDDAPQGRKFGTSLLHPAGTPRGCHPRDHRHVFVLCRTCQKRGPFGVAKSGVTFAALQIRTLCSLCWGQQLHVFCPSRCRIFELSTVTRAYILKIGSHAAHLLHTTTYISGVCIGIQGSYLRFILDG